MTNRSLGPQSPKQVKQRTKNRILRAIRDGALFGRKFVAKPGRLICHVGNVKHVIELRTFQWEGTEYLSLGLGAGVSADGFETAFGRPEIAFPHGWDCLVYIIERENPKGGMIWKGQLPWPEETFERITDEMNAVCEARLLPFLDGFKSRSDLSALLLSAPADKLPLRLPTEAHRWQLLAVLAKLDGDLETMNDYLDRAGACVSKQGLDYHEAICARLRGTA